MVLDDGEGDTRQLARDDHQGGSTGQSTIAISLVDRSPGTGFAG